MRMRQRHHRGLLAPMALAVTPQDFTLQSSQLPPREASSSPYPLAHPRPQPHDRVPSGRTSRSALRPQPCLPALQHRRGSDGAIRDFFPIRSSSVLGKTSPLPDRCWSPTELRKCLHMQSGRSRNSTQEMNNSKPVIVVSDETVGHGVKAESLAEECSKQQQLQGSLTSPQNDNDADEQQRNFQASVLHPFPSIKAEGRAFQVPVRDPPLIKITDGTSMPSKGLPSLSSSQLQLNTGAGTAVSHQHQHTRRQERHPYIVL